MENKAALYINAWDTDFAEDPLIAFIGQVHENIDELGLTPLASEKLRSKLMDIAKAGLNIGLRIGIRAAVGAAVHSAVDGKVDTVADAALKEGSEEAEKYVLGRIKSFSGEKAARQAFKVQLESWQKEVTVSRKKRRTQKPNEDEKIYIFIDELDRCRPDYAIRMLESIKHLFSIGGFVFVAFVDEDQLQRQTSFVYGERPNGEPFLRKFIDYRFSLPRPSNFDFCKFMLENSQFKSAMLESRGNTPPVETTEFSKLLAFYSDKLGLSLRTQWRVFRTLEMVLMSYDVFDYRPMVFLACLREHDLEAWQEFSRVFKSPDRALDQIEYIEFKNRFNANPEESDADLLKIYLYTRVFFDDSKLDDLTLDQITMKAKQFFEDTFGVNASDDFRAEENEGLCNQIELVESFNRY